MLGTDVIVTHPARFLEGDLDHLLDARGRNDLLDDDPLVASEDRLDRLADFPDLDAEVVKNLGGQALTLAEQAQEQWLGPSISGVALCCLTLGLTHTLR